MKTVVLLLLAFWFASAAAASDTLAVMLNKSELNAGDTISFVALYTPWKTSKKVGTLNVVIEDIHHKTVWPFRYPIMDGEATGNFVIPADIPADVYACHFSLQDDFFAMKGKVLSLYKDSTIKITMLLADREFMQQTITLNAQKEFSLKKLLFADRAKVFFAPTRKNRTNDLEIQLDVSLDSAFTPLHEQLHTITIGHVDTNTLKNGYSFDPKLFNTDGSTLQSVEVIAKKKTAVELYENERVSGMFKVSDSYTFDGMESNQFIGFPNIIEWLRGRVAGLRIQPTGNGVDYTASWQGSETFFFLDEMQVDIQTIATIPTSDIALVKAFRPPFYGAYLGGAGGAIGVYTKIGIITNNGPKHQFLVNGYTPETIQLPLKSNL